jgi:hypothetical protein
MKICFYKVNLGHNYQKCDLYLLKDAKINATQSIFLLN